MRSNRVYVCDDVEADPPSGADLSEYRRADIRSVVIVPLSKGSRFIARMSMHQRTPRIWTPEEIDLITTVANRCWESVERARAIRRLEKSEERYRAFIGNSSEAIWRFELDEPIPVELPPSEQLEMIYRFAYLAESVIEGVLVFGPTVDPHDDKTEGGNCDREQSRKATLKCIGHTHSRTPLRNSDKPNKSIASRRRLFNREAPVRSTSRRRAH